MKKYSSYLKILFIAFASLLVTGCVHDDKYNDPNLDNYQCKDLTATMTITQVKALHGSTRYVFPANSTAIMEGYVSSTDESGNIYKTIYIQDDPVNPTEGFTISVDAVSTYTKYPQGSKIYIELKGLALGTYGGLVQLGIEDDKAIATGADAVSRIPEKAMPAHIFRSCTIRKNIIPKVMTLTQMSSNDKLLGALIQVNDAEFDQKVLCNIYAPEGFTVDRQLNDPTLSSTARVVRNSGFASFANQLLPAGKGKFIGIFSKFNSSYQMYINKVSDLADMTHFPRKDGITTNPCGLDQASLTAKTVAEVKQLASVLPISGDFLLKGKVTANDQTNNFVRQIYIEDATGGIRVNINKTNLYQDPRFKVGKEVFIKLKGLSVGSAPAINGEMQIGFGGPAGAIAEADMYKYFFDSNNPATTVVPTERKIKQLTMADVGRWVVIKDLEFTDAELGKTYVSGTSTERTLKDCEGNTILLTTSTTATFKGAEVDSGKGNVYAVVTFQNGAYQLRIPRQADADIDGARCDGTVPPVYNILFQDGFDTLDNWTAVNVTGTQVWATTTFGNPRPSAIMDGNRQLNEDWLVSKKISLAGMQEAYFTFETDGRFSGNPLEVYVSSNFTGVPATTTWVKMNPALDSDLGGFSGFVGSGRVNLKDFINKDVVIAFKYTSVAGFSTTWEVDNFTVKGAK
ncbi:choice-of-anchor J domain-containing protein [Kaistella sp. DKR-2]|uniref:DUF5689 domain-containing protein n=1 Tax=Kaistella soli TaxID=2849654 RepID=UPI001C271826|nr:DUF5689 domain-containing protein [Kaistella soli]MBU8883603.1 choice-of-anchor J domain-containing protein [Kaistella soli]